MPKKNDNNNKYSPKCYCGRPAVTSDNRGKWVCFQHSSEFDKPMVQIVD